MTTDDILFIFLDMLCIVCFVFGRWFGQREIIEKNKQEVSNFFARQFPGVGGKI